MSHLNPALLPAHPFRSGHGNRLAAVGFGQETLQPGDLGLQALRIAGTV